MLCRNGNPHLEDASSGVVGFNGTFSLGDKSCFCWIDAQRRDLYLLSSCAFESDLLCARLQRWHINDADPVGAPGTGPEGLAQGAGPLQSYLGAGEGFARFVHHVYQQGRAWRRHVELDGRESLGRGGGHAQDLDVRKPDIIECRLHAIGSRREACELKVSGRVGGASYAHKVGELVFARLGYKHRDHPQIAGPGAGRFVADLHVALEFYRPRENQS